MLPPVDEAVLKSNPNFTALYLNLSDNILRLDGSTKSHAAQREQDEVSKAYKQARIHVTKHQILINALEYVDLTDVPQSRTKPAPPSESLPSESLPSESLPPELVELILLLASYFSSTSTTIPPSLKSTPLFALLSTHLPRIGSLLSSYLHSLCLMLARITSPTTNPSYMHRQVPSLAHHAKNLHSTIATQRLALSSRRLALMPLIHKLLASYNRLTTLTITILEQSKHGLLSRHTKAKAEFLTKRAKEVSLKGKEKLERGQQMVYTPRVMDALETYMNELRGAKERWSERGREARRILWGYGVGREGQEGETKRRKMREMAKTYGEMSLEIEGVKRDLVRLGGGKP